MLYSKIEGSGQPLIILHGFLGMSDNWKTLATQFATQYEVHTLDLRNHGRSLQSEEFNYEIMAQDVLDYCQVHNLTKINIIGHSMGGKVAMLLAARQPELVSKLIVADIGPKFYPQHHQDILAGLNAVDFSMYTRYLERNFDSEIEKVAFFRNLIEPLKEHYDFIFIDVPPTLSLLNDTAFYACDQIVVVLQTQERSLAGAEVFINYLQNTLIDEFHSDVDILGILPVLSKKGSRVDDEILKAAFQEFGEENIFNNKISIMERVKRMDMEGITDNKKDMHDRRVHKIFTDVSKEIITRLER